MTFSGCFSEVWKEKFQYCKCIHFEALVYRKTEGEIIWVGTNFVFISGCVQIHTLIIMNSLLGMHQYRFFTPSIRTKTCSLVIVSTNNDTDMRYLFNQSSWYLYLCLKRCLFYSKLLVTLGICFTLETKVRLYWRKALDHPERHTGYVFISAHFACFHFRCAWLSVMFKTD